MGGGAQMNRHIMAAWGVLIVLLVSLLAYNIGYSNGYSKKHSPIYIKTTGQSINLVQTLKDCGVDLTGEQIRMLGDKLKKKKGG
jgi:hypothetical protein